MLTAGTLGDLGRSDDVLPLGWQIIRHAYANSPPSSAMCHTCIVGFA